MNVREGIRVTAGVIARRVKRLLIKAGVGEVLRVMADPRTTWLYARDYWSTRRQYGALLSSWKAPADPLGRALIVGIHGFVPSAKEEGMYGMALGMRGYLPVCLVHRSSRVIKHYRLFGIKDFEFFEEYLARVDRGPLEQEAAVALAGTPTYTDLIDYEYRGVHVGRHVLSTIARRLHKGTLQLDEPVVQAMLRELMPEAMRAVLAAEALFDAIRPSVVLFNERGYTPFGELFDVALSRKLNTIQWVASHRDDARIYKRYTAETHNVHPHSLADNAWEALKSLPWTDGHREALFRELYSQYASGGWFNFQRLQHNKQIKSRTEVQRQLGLDPAKKTAIVFSHVLWDATFFYGESLFEDYEKWLVATVRAACRNPIVNWIVKLHPVNVWRLEADGYHAELTEQVVLREQVGPLPSHVKLLMPDTDINTFSLFDVADYCVTVRGTIGIEISAYGVPVLVAGTGRYSGRGFTIDASSQEEYLENLARIQDFPRPSREETELARRHAYALFNLRPLLLRSFEIVHSRGRNVFHSLDGQLVVRAKSLADLAAASDLSRFAEWAVQSADPDLMLPWPAKAKGHSSW